MNISRMTQTAPQRKSKKKKNADIMTEEHNKHQCDNKIKDNHIKLNRDYAKKKTMKKSTGSYHSGNT